MVIKKGYFAVLFALVFSVLIGLSVASGVGGGGSIGILDTGLFINVTFPQNGGMYSSLISNFDWVLLSNTSALVSCSVKANGVSSAFSCNVSSVSISSQEGLNELNLSIISGDSATFPSILFIIDTIPPSFSALGENPANSSAYATGQFYEFSVDVSDAGAGVNNVWYEFNGMNYTDVYSSGSTYYFNKSDLAAGSYGYQWFANDSLGNFNQSGAYTYTVVPADPTSGMSIVGDDNITYGEYTDFAGVSSNTGDSGCAYFLAPLNSTLFGAGVVTFTLSTSGCANYTAGSVTRNLTVLQAVPVLTFLANGGTANLTLTYGESANMSATTNGIIIGNVVSVGLDRDGASVLGENGLDVVLAGNKTYTYRANVTGNQNYSDLDYSYLSVVINRASSTTSLIVDPASPVVYGSASNFSCSNSAGLATFLDLNGNDASAELGLNVVRSADTYSANCSSSENENYTGSSDFLVYVVNRAVPSLSLTFSPSSTVSSGTTTNASGVGCPSQLTCKLYRNGIEVNNSDVVTLGAGTYSYEFNTTGNENYTNASVSETLTVKSSYSGSGGSGYRSNSCYSDWTCTDWSTCKDSLQTRECSLIQSRCYPSEAKPSELQVCDSPGGLNNSASDLTEEPAREIINPEPEGRAGAGITGGVIGVLSSGSFIALIVFAGIILAAYGYVIVRRRNFQNALERTLAEAK